MPKSKYIIVCEKRLADVASGMASHINVIEQLLFATDLQSAIANPQFNPTFRLFLTAVWTKEPTDSEDDVFELDTRMFSSANEPPKTLHVGEAKFLSINLRVDLQLPIFPQLPPGNGAISLESRIRKKGSLDWISQCYEIPVFVEGPRSPAE
jgi:hypothetical protein